MTLRRFEHTVVLAIAIELSMVIAFGVLMQLPRWKLAPFAPTARRDYYDPRAWSPEGSSLLTSAGGGGFQVIRPDGSLLLPEASGAWPVWIDDRTIVALEEVDEETYRLVRQDTGDGSRRAIGAVLGLGSLMADGRGRVAYQSIIGSLDTTVLDPLDGRVLGRLAGYRARTWAKDGALIVRQPEPLLQNNYYGAGALFLWRPGEAPRALAPDLIDLGAVAPLSPAGDAIACVCAAADARSANPDRALYRVPIDGSELTEMASWHSESASDLPEVTWLDATSLAMIDDDGLSRVSVNGGKRTIPGLSTAELGYGRTTGRVYALGDVIVAILKDRAPPGSEPVLVVVDAQDRIRVRGILEAWNLPVFSGDGAHDRGVVSTDPNRPGEPPQEFFLLELR